MNPQDNCRLAQDNKAIIQENQRLVQALHRVQQQLEAHTQRRDQQAEGAGEGCSASGERGAEDSVKETKRLGDNTLYTSIPRRRDRTQTHTDARALTYILSRDMYIHAYTYTSAEMEVTRLQAENGTLQSRTVRWHTCVCVCV